MKMSDKIDLLATALSKAQSEINGAARNKKNPFFKSDYADLDSVWNAVRGPLTNNGLACHQGTEETEKGTIFETTIMHLSGQWITSSIKLSPVK